MGKWKVRAWKLWWKRRRRRRRREKPAADQLCFCRQSRTASASANSTCMCEWLARSQRKRKRENKKAGSSPGTRYTRNIKVFTGRRGIECRMKQLHELLALFSSLPLTLHPVSQEPADQTPVLFLSIISLLWPLLVSQQYFPTLSCCIQWENRQRAFPSFRFRFISASGFRRCSSAVQIVLIFHWLRSFPTPLSLTVKQISVFNTFCVYVLCVVSCIRVTQLIPLFRPFFHTRLKVPGAFCAQHSFFSTQLSLQRFKIEIYFYLYVKRRPNSQPKSLPAVWRESERKEEEDSFISHLSLHDWNDEILKPSSWTSACDQEQVSAGFNPAPKNV